MTPKATVDVLNSKLDTVIDQVKTVIQEIKVISSTVNKQEEKNSHYEHELFDSNGNSKVQKAQGTANASLQLSKLILIPIVLTLIYAIITKLI